MPGMTSFLRAVLLFLLAGLSACAPLGDARLPLPLEIVPAAAPPARRLVVVLPGRRDDLDALRDAGIARAFTRNWPGADIVLAGATTAYYRDGAVTRRLHEEVIAPARARGVREVWLCGASMGGLGAMLHALEYPGDIDGLILLAPYLGEPELIRSIAAEGGLRAFDRGPARPVTRENFAEEVWKRLAQWAREPGSGPQVWIAFGRDDRLAAAAPLLSELVPAARLLIRDGGHAWRVWTPAAGEIAARIGDAPKDPP